VLQQQSDMARIPYRHSPKTHCQSKYYYEYY